jgi:hypothetical protein
MIVPTAARYFRGADGALWHRAASGQESRTTGGSISTPDLAWASRADGVDAVFLRAHDRALWMIECTGAKCGAWINLGGVLASPPVAAGQPDGTIVVTVTGMDNRAWQITVRDRAVVSGWKHAP